jgi:hypothetical protein
MATGVVFTYSRAYNRATRRKPSSVAVLNGGASACERYLSRSVRASSSSGLSRWGELAELQALALRPEVRADPAGRPCSLEYRGVP